MPEGEKDDKLDGQDFKEGGMLFEVVAKLEVELDETIHGNRYADRFDTHYLSKALAIENQVHPFCSIPIYVQIRASKTPGSTCLQLE